MLLSTHAQAQFYQPRPYLLEFSGSFESRQYYTNAYTQTIFNYDMKYEQWIFFFEGAPPFNYKTGLFLQERQDIDSRIISRISIFNDVTSGRTTVDSKNTNVDLVRPESYAGIFYRQRIWDDWIATEVEWKLETGLQFSHQGLHGEFGLIIRFLQNDNTKFYLTRFIRYGDANYLNAWFGTIPQYPNNSINNSFYETEDKIIMNTSLTKRQFLNVEFTRARLLNSAADSLAVLNIRDNGFKIAYGWRF
ncbi:MAG: MipA/OmpV family protein [Alphaproteobacteria bacterium]|nr:MipA/OmpV family protein [Alphaproteobacteria bacterium]